MPERMANISEMEQSSLNDIVASMYERVAQLESMLSDVGFQSQETRKRKFPIKQQSSKEQSMSRALCVETIDPKRENRVRFFHPRITEPETKVLELPFARPISSMGGIDDSGLNWVPPAGATLCLVFNNGDRSQAFYIGTTWPRNRKRSDHGYQGMREYQAIYEGHRGGYTRPELDEKQVLVQWNTESYNGPDLDNTKAFIDSPFEQMRSTFPNIYGFKTPEKHMLKMVDGDAKCNRRWKRIELLSGCGNWMIFKDDHLHYGGQWAHPSCPPDPGGGTAELCSISDSDLPYLTDIKGKPIEKESLCRPNCSASAGLSCESIIQGHPSTPNNPAPVKTKYDRTNVGTNPYFKHKNECRPYRGPGTPQNNRCHLPQSGIQMLSISGHTWVMDDSVEEPKGKPEWERSLSPFDFGCNDKYLGVMWMKSATGHLFAMSDVEKEPKLRGTQNFIKLLTATGNKIELNDHTEPEKDCPGCPPNYAGEQRGIHLESTSQHVIKMIDHLNKQCGPCRSEGGTPENKATRAYIQIRSGYGLEMRYNDDFSQRETQQQWIQIFHPHCAGDEDKKCNACEECECRGPHIMRFQGRPKGEPGVIYLRAGGHSIRQTYDMDIVLVGDKECNPSDKFTYVTKKFITAAEDVHFRYTGELHIFFAEKKILLMAGRDCPPKEGKKCCAPCLYSVIISRCPVLCPVTKILHWTEDAMSERVFASGHHPCQDPPDCGSGCEAYFAAMAKCGKKGCVEDEEEGTEIDTGQGTVTVGGSTPQTQQGDTSPSEGPQL